MPLVPGTLVLMYQADKGRIVHVGMYIGNGDVIESRGVDYGVVKLSCHKEPGRIGDKFPGFRLI